MNVSWLLEAALIIGGLVLMSFIVISILYWRARRQLESFDKKGEDPEVNTFWMENILGRGRFKVYVLSSFVLSIGAMAADHFVPLLVAGPTPWWWTIRSVPEAYNVFSSFLVFFALIMGFLVPRRLYHYFKDDVLQGMMVKAEQTSRPEKIKRTLRMSTLVAGGSCFYQGVCVLVTIAFFIVIHLFFVIPQWQEIAGFMRSFDVSPFLGSWSRLLVCILMGGVVGPMATTVSAFTIFCGIKFKGKDFFDPLAEDRRGGFGSLGTLGMWSSFMAAVTPGVAVPVLFIGLKTTSEIVISVGLLFFLIICIVLFFFVPIYYVYGAIKTSRKLRILKFKDPYRTKFNEFMKKVEDGKPTEMTETLSMLALKGIYDDMTVISDWPVDYFTVLKVIASAVLPVLSYIVKYFTLA